jgi:hypothetical protein
MELQVKRTHTVRFNMSPYSHRALHINVCLEQHSDVADHVKDVETFLTMICMADNLQILILKLYTETKNATRIGEKKYLQNYRGFKHRWFSLTFIHSLRKVV